MKTIPAVLHKCYRSFADPLLRRWKYGKLKMKWHGKVRFDASNAIDSEARFEGANSLGRNSVFSGSMGYGTYICGDCHLTASIGRFCSIGAEVRTAIGTHPTSAPFATTSPMFYSLRKQAMTTFTSRQLFQEILPAVIIGHDVWIGDKVEIVGGVKIGDGAVILTGAVVTKDVLPYSIVGGVPARIVKYRYDTETIQWLLKVRWWDKPLDWLRENWELMCDIDKLREALDDN